MGRVWRSGSLRSTWGAGMVVLGLLLAAAPVAAADVQKAAVAERARRIFRPLPENAATEARPMTPERVALGRMLYYDTRLSINQQLSCNTCHVLSSYGVDNEPTSPGHEGVRGDRNSPTVYNAALHIAQFWDGRAADVEEQAKGPVLNPVEMGMPSPEYVLKVLHSIPGYADLFAKAFPGDDDPIDYDNFGLAIGAFERGLLTPAPFDAFLEGDVDALTTEQAEGLDLFISAGCITCHIGVGVGGGMYQKLGLQKPYETEDLGRYKVTGNERDKYVFKVPSLRNVVKTWPYFHDGKVETLPEAVRLMGVHQLGRDFTDAEIASIVAFLGSLTGEIPQDYIAVPDLPAAESWTPPADPS